LAIFLSYARRDATAVGALHGDLDRAKQAAWYDRDLEGGERWWDAILGQIRQCDLLVFVLSPDSIRSRACRMELAYAVALQRPILPVMVRDVQVELAPDPIGVTHIVDYRERTSESAIALVLAVEQARGAVPLPDPLPDPPAPPITDLGPLRDRVAAERLTFAEQSNLVAELRRHADDVDQHATVLALLEQLRQRADAAAAITREIDALILTIPVSDDDWSPARRRPSKRPLSERDPDSVDLLRSLVAHIRAGQFTPIVGLGLTDSLVGPRRLLARQWARTFEFPMAKHQQEDLPGVAQFVTVMTNAATLRSSLDEYLRAQLHPSAPAATNTTAAAADAPVDLASLVRAAWDRLRAEDPDEPHVVLAKLPCPIYVVAHPWDLLAEALRAEGKAPVVELCRWKHDVYDWPASVFDTDPDYAPSPERPLVYHAFGRLDFPDSLVLTEDDYFDFLIGVTQDRSLIPTAVRRVLADSALLLLGFGLEDWDVRVLLRTLVSQEGARKLHKYTHVAAQLDLSGGVVSPARAQRYLERYFGKHREPSIDIYWGSVDEFAADLAAVWAGPR
jgi:TIR domain/SIR2-like domain